MDMQYRDATVVWKASKRALVASFGAFSTLLGLWSCSLVTASSCGRLLCVLLLLFFLAPSILLLEAWRRFFLACFAWCISLLLVNSSQGLSLLLFTLALVPILATGPFIIIMISFTLTLFASVLHKGQGSDGRDHEHVVLGVWFCALQARLSFVKVEWRHNIVTPIRLNPTLCTCTQSVFMMHVCTYACTGADA